MASLIHGYEYDIFISYRQKDNKGDRWVSEFVQALKTELESTFKDNVSVYFDNNPHTGLLETHDVDDSLKEKLKCLIFIPVISRTYCDPRSFAWEHEFKAFVKQASQDQLGLKVKLQNGNVGSRVLPVRIHDLDNCDIKLCESVLDGALRGIDFIYKEPGVDRPLTSNDDERGNLNNTIYRNQVNKVALAIKEIIDALSAHENIEIKSPEELFKPIPAYKKNLKSKTIKKIGLLLVLVLLGYFLILRTSESPRAIEKSIAILPFMNDSPNDSTRYFINGVMEEILTNLQTIRDLRVISRNSVEQFRGETRPSTPEIARKLGVNYIVEGSGQKYGKKIRLRVQLIRAAKENHLWARSYEREINEINDIFTVQNQIAEDIAKELKAVITPQEENLIWQKPTNDTLAYDYYLKGRQFNSGLMYDKAIDMFTKAIVKDPEFALPLLFRSDLYSKIFMTKGLEYKYRGDWKGLDIRAKEDLERAVNINPDLPEIKIEQAVQLYSFDRNYDKALKLMSEVESQMSNNLYFFYWRAAIYRRMGKWEQSLSDWQKTILLDPLNAAGYIESGHTCQLMRKYPDAIEYFNKSLLLDQNQENLTGKIFTNLLWKGDWKEALNDFDIAIDSGIYKSFSFYYGRQFEKLLTVAKDYEDQFGYYPKKLGKAQAYYFAGNKLLCRQYADSAIADIKIKLSEFPDDERYYSSLGFAYAYKGDYKKAIANAQKAVKLKPIKLDSWQGYAKEVDLVRIYIIAGQSDLAMDKIEFLLSIPGNLSVPLLKLDPSYDKLRNLPRFKKILITEY